ERSGRPPSAVALLPVTKTIEAGSIRAAYELGLREFGENRVQELVEKADALPDDVAWHLIGHLQRNKVRKAIGVAARIQSIDSLRLAEVVAAAGRDAGKRVRVLVEVNTSGEASKGGLEPE